MIIVKTRALEEARVRRGLTKCGLASKLGINHSVIVRAEKEASVSPRTAKAMCDFFGMEFSQLFIVGDNRN